MQGFILPFYTFAYINIFALFFFGPRDLLSRSLTSIFVFFCTIFDLASSLYISDPFCVDFSPFVLLILPLLLLQSFSSDSLLYLQMWVCILCNPLSGNVLFLLPCISSPLNKQAIIHKKKESMAGIFNFAATPPRFPAGSRSPSSTKHLRSDFPELKPFALLKCPFAEAAPARCATEKYEIQVSVA